MLKSLMTFILLTTICFSNAYAQYIYVSSQLETEGTKTSTYTVSYPEDILISFVHTPGQDGILHYPLIYVSRIQVFVNNVLQFSSGGNLSVILFWSCTLDNVQPSSVVKVQIDFALTVPQSSPEPPATIVVTSQHTLPLIISSNTTLTSNNIYYASSNVTVNSGVTLTINPGATLEFASGKSLTVNGTLNMQGTSSNPVTFNFSGGATNKGIQINSNGHFDISYTEIDGPGIGMYVNEGWGTIDNTIFNNHFTDLHLYRTNYAVNDVYLTDNTFNAAEEGLILEYSSPKLVGNKFSGNQYGIQASNYSSAQLGYVNQEGRNVFDYCQWGSITGYNNCNLFLGKADCITNGGYNSFKFNSVVFMFPHIDVSNYCQVTAEQNWWGRSSPSMGVEFYADGTSSIDYTPYLTSDPNPLAKIIARKNPEEAEFDNAFVSASIKSNLNRNGTASKAVQLTGGIESLFSYFDKNWTLKKKLTFARRLLGISVLSDYTEDVKTICKDIIRDNKDSSLCFFALDILWKAYKKSNQQAAFNEYLNTLITNQENYTDAAAEFLASAELIAAGFNYENEIASINNFLEKYKGEASIEYALYQKFMHQKNEGKIEKAKNTAEELGKLFPESRGMNLQ